MADTYAQQRTMVDIPLGMVLIIPIFRKVQRLKSRGILDRGFNIVPTYAELVNDFTAIR
jgi:hypothetical protein